jgi:hypothetical protein
MTATPVEQFTVNCTQALAIRFVDTFHTGDEIEKEVAKTEFTRLTKAMYADGTACAVQCKVLLRTMQDALHGNWPS